jgi:NAD(P) transhydrogenase subunit alpha
MAQQASQLYGTNLYHLLAEMGGGNNYQINFEDEVIRGALVVHKGEITWPPPKVVPADTKTSKQEDKQKESSDSSSPAAREIPAAVQTSSLSSSGQSSSSSDLWLLLMGLALLGIGISAPASFLSHLTVFVLACFVGWQVIWNVKPALHTPLMSVTNAISGIIIIGGMLQLSGGSSLSATILGAIAILVGTINISGGFLVTQRMLKMFQK